MPGPVLRIESAYTIEELQEDLEFVLPIGSAEAVRGKSGILAKKAVELRVAYTQLALEVRDCSEE